MVVSEGSVRLGDRLVAKGVILPEDLDRARARALEHGTRVRDVLVAEGLANESAVWSELAAMWGVPMAQLDTSQIDESCAEVITPELGVIHQVVPFRSGTSGVWIAAVDPTDLEMRRLVAAQTRFPLSWFAAPPGAVRQAQEHLWARSLARRACTTTLRFDRDASADRLLTRPQMAFGLLVLTGLLVGLAKWTSLTLLALTGATALVYGAASIFRTRSILRGARSGPGEKVAPGEIRGLGRLPIYTVLCPIYHESSVVSELISHLMQLDYPKENLDIKLLVEEDDSDTLERLGEIEVPSFCELVTIPGVGPRTKPKACNYGLEFARGEYVVIFDAEDRPEPDQLKKALAVFQRHRLNRDSSIGCVQAQLAFYNARQNWLTGWFALEYLSFFRYFLPGLVSLGLPVPLGGTSNHFPVDVLRKVGAWDAFNVTEDADLGIRLNRAGYQTRVVESTTWEEANSDFVNWTKQRSRWGKGYFVTWAVHMRHPLRLFRQLGLRGWLSLQITLAFTYAAAVVNLLLWGSMVVWILGQPSSLAALYPPAIYYLAMLELILGNFFFLYITLWCATESGEFELSRLALSYPVYWVMISIAMAKATVQLLTDHVYWEKTTHGLMLRSEIHKSPEPGGTTADGLAGPPERYEHGARAGLG